MENNKIRIGICGYGNLGKGVEKAILKNSDMELVAIFTRRNPSELKTFTDTKVDMVNNLPNWKDDIDVLIMCGGSATDLPNQVPMYAGLFNTIDSFDTHAKILEYFKNVDAKASEGGKISIISVGWDPGLFSQSRLLADSILPGVHLYTFWGKGVSQGHSDAIRRIEGVKDARQYTIPIDEAMNRVRNGENPVLSVREKHKRECFVVACEGADKNKIENEIKNMPNYFDEYDTTVHFITEEELQANHNGMPHGGSVIACAKTGDDNNQVIEYSLNLDSNPEFTASVLTAYARAAYRMYKSGDKGAKTVFDVSPALLSQKTRGGYAEDVIEKWLRHMCILLPQYC